MVDKVYVYIFLPEAQWVVCGLLEYNENGRYSDSYFRYGKKYLMREDKIAIDPIQLPLCDDTLEVPQDFILFNGIRDAGPDQWGRHLLDRKFGRTLTELEYVIATGSDRVGALAFSDDPALGPRVYSPQGFNSLVEKRLDLSDCVGAIDDINAMKMTERLKEYLCYGPSLGGARPKATVNWQEKTCLAKFSLPNDSRNEPLLEYATMLLAKECGLNVPPIKVVKMAETAIYLIERFDRTVTHCPIPFISGLTVTGLHEQDYSRWSYHLLVDAILKFSRDPMRDLQELFKRMVFNILVYNNDDHLRNFGFLYEGNQHWNLSPLYDVIPAIVSSQNFNLAMIVGMDGKKASVENALSLCERFRLSKQDAEGIILDMKQKMMGWREHYKKCGITDQQIAALENSFSDK